MADDQLKKPTRNGVQNRFLGRLSADDRAGILAAGELVDFAEGQTIYRHDDVVDWVYFPEGGIISIVASTADGFDVETGVVGSDGVIGLFEALASARYFPAATAQLQAQAWKVPAARCVEICSSGTPRHLIDRHNQAMLSEARQCVACQAFHLMEARLARWLLECSERGNLDDVVPFTQEFIAVMLGVRRTSVNAAIGILVERGVLRTTRGRLDIIDRPGLEGLACECRKVILDLRSILYE